MVEPRLRQRNPNTGEFSTGDPVKNLYAFVHTRLPKLNMANYKYEQNLRRQNQGKITRNLSDLVIVSNNSAAQILERYDLSRLSLQQAFYLHLPLAIMLASVARFQTDDRVLEKQMEPTIDALLVIGGQYGLPPWLTTAEYYLHNQPNRDGKRVTFTDNGAEELFIEISEASVRHFDQAASSLDAVSLSENDRDIDTKRLREATSHLVQARDQFSRYNSDPRWDGDFFFTTLRGFSRPGTIRGIAYPSKSIATNAAQRTIDVQLGLSQQSGVYREDTLIRLDPAMAGQDTDRLRRALNRASNGYTLRDRLAEIIEVDKETTAISTEEEQSTAATLFAKIDAYLENNEDRLRQNLVGKNLEDLVKAYIDLTTQNAQLSGTHRMLIVRNIHDPQAKAERRGEIITVEQSRHGDIGLGGLPIEEVERLQRVRQRDPFIYLLKKLVL